jgi:hypothetical protein
MIWERKADRLGGTGMDKRLFTYRTVGYIEMDIILLYYRYPLHQKFSTCAVENWSVVAMSSRQMR